MVKKLANILGVVVLAGSYAFGEQTNSIPISAEMNLSFLYKEVSKIQIYSCEKTPSGVTNLWGNISSRAFTLYQDVMRESRDIGESLTTKVHDVLHTPWNISVRKSSSSEREGREVSFYYCTEF